jgi:hypothetical protein
METLLPSPTGSRTPAVLNLDGFGPGSDVAIDGTTKLRIWYGDGSIRRDARLQPKREAFAADLLQIQQTAITAATDD